MRQFLLLCLVFHSVQSAFSQDVNVLNSPPEELMRFLGHPYPKIEVEIIKYTGTGVNRFKAKDKSTFKTIEYKNPGICRVINKSKDGAADTLTYKYDRCGLLYVKQGGGSYCEYGNRYKNCVLVSKKANETEVFTGGFSHQLQLVRYTYNKLGQLSKEVMYDFEDSTVAKYSQEYFYTGSNKDSIKEYYYDEDGKKLINRMTRFYYTNQRLDSIEHLNAFYTVIDKLVYSYGTDGKLKMIKNGSEYCEYVFVNHILEKIIELGGGKEYVFRYLE